MKNRINWIIVTIVTISLLFSFIGCKDPDLIELDQTAPAEVTNLVVTAADGNAVLTWTNPEDTDFAGVQVAMSPAEGTLANAVSLGKDVTSLNVSGLKVGSEYTFTVKTFDTSLNYSTGATEKATVADNSEKPDTTAPADVTNLVATNIATSVLLEWKDAQDADIFGYEVSWDKTIPVNRSVSMEANTMMIAPKTQGCYVSNLEIGESYTFTVKSVDLSGNKSAGQTATIIYTPNDAEISLESISIPDAGESYAGQILPVVIKGKNFKSPYFEVDTLEAEGVKKFQVISNTLIQAEIECPSTVGSYTVEVKCGKLSKSTTYRVIEDEKCFNVGDILFTDGTRIKAENTKYGVPNTQVENAFGVVASAPYGGATGKVVGLQMSSESLPWALYETTGFYTNFTEIQVNDYYEFIDGKVYFTFTGDLDGSDNWEEIKKADPEGTDTPEEIATNYPAFNYALNYGASLEETDYAEGWYIPSAAELYDIYINEEVVNTSLTEVGVPSIPTYCWSSSQCANNKNSAYYWNGGVSSRTKDWDFKVLVIQSIDGDRFTEYVPTTIPTIDSVTIATAGEGYTGELPVTIIGENLKGHAITCDDASFGNVKVVSDTKATATITCNGVVGETSITVTIGNDTESGTVKVLARDKCFNVGDILFTDGTRIKAENVKYGIPDSQMDKVFGVVASATYGGGTGKAVGLQKSSSSLKWAPSGTTGYNTKFTGIQAYSSGSSSSGYTFTGDLDGSDNWEEICKVDPEGTADAATNYPAFDYALNYGETADLTETDYAEGWYIPSVAELYDVYTNKEEVQTSLTAVGGFTIGTSIYRSSSQYAYNFPEAYIVGFNDGYVGFRNKSYSDSVLVVQAFNAELFNNYEYADATIDSVTIPTVGEGYTGELPVTIVGENLKGHAITCSDASFGNVKVVSDTKATATITCNGVVGETSITVTIGNDTESGTVKVLARDKCFDVGDILFTDGTRIKAENVKYGIPDTQYEKAFGVVVSASYGGATGKVVGLQKSSSSLMWAPSGTTGYNTNFEGIQADKSGSSSSGYTFTGDLDGSDNWEEICKVDPEGTADAAANYPAFDYALNYGETPELTGTKYETGWYIPSVAELYDVYKNKEEVQTSLTAVGGFTIGTSIYRSSSQYAYNFPEAYIVGFNDGYVGFRNKSYSDSVLVVQAFNAELFNNYEYADAKIESVTIPTAGEGYTGELPVTIVGENLKGHAITCSDASFSNVTYVSDTKVTAEVTCPYVAGETTVTVNCAEASGTAKIKVIKTEECYTDADIGKIVLEDGSIVAKEDYDSTTMKAIAVVVGTKYAGGQVLGVGLQQSSRMWAPSGTTGYSIKVEKIICTPSETGSGAASTATFAGDIDGSDNWEEICKVDPEGTKDAATNYPAFDYANNYGATQGITGNYKDGWYIPSQKELCDIYKVKDTIKDVITEVGGNLDMSFYYWSSSQNATNSKGNAFACGVLFSDGYVVNGDKGTDLNVDVLVIQAFNAQ